MGMCHFKSVGIIFLGLALFGMPGQGLSEGLVHGANLTYLGSFRVPQGTYNNISFAYGGYGIGYYSENNSLFIGSIYGEYIAEITIPEPVNSSDLGELNIAEVRQPWVDITEGNLNNIGAGGAPCTGNRNMMGGMFVYGDRLIGTVYNYYDAGYCAELSHFYCSLDLAAEGDFQGMFRVGDSEYNVGLKADYMTTIPFDWQEHFGGAPALTGRSFGAILTRSSFGPSISTFFPDALGVIEPSPSTVLSYYPGEGANATFGTYSGGFDGGPCSPNPYVSPKDIVAGAVFPEGTDSVLFIGNHGDGAWCYKCPEPNNPAGNGSYPYKYMVWAYDANDLAASYTGNYVVTQEDFVLNRFWTGVFPNNTALPTGSVVEPYNVVPYETWELQVPIYPDTSYTHERVVGGATLDPGTNRLYMSAMHGDQRRPLIHAFQLNMNKPGPPVDTKWHEN